MRTETRAIVYQTVAAYKRRCWWLDTADMAQVGFIAALEAERSFAPEAATEFAAYVRRAVTYAIKRALWLESAPVSGGTHRPEQTRIGLHRATLLDDICADANDNPEQALIDHEWRMSIRSIIENKHGSTVASVLFGEATANEVTPPGQPVRKTYHTVAQAREAIANDLELWTLLAARDT